MALEGKQLWLEEAWLDTEANGIFCNDSGRTFGHSQRHGMWMFLDFIVSNCTSEHSPLPTFFCTAKNLISATVWLISGKALGAPGSFLSSTLHPFLDRSWQEAVSTLSGTSPVTGFFHIREFSLLWIFSFNLGFGPLNLKSDVFRLHQAATLQLAPQNYWKPLFSLKDHFVLKELVIKATNPPKPETTCHRLIRTKVLQCGLKVTRL